MNEFLDRVRTGVQQQAVQPCEAEDTDGEVLGQQFVQADNPKVLHHADLEFREVPEEHRGFTGGDVRHIVVERIELGKNVGGVPSRAPSCQM